MTLSEENEKNELDGQRPRKNKGLFSGMRAKMLLYFGAVFFITFAILMYLIASSTKMQVLSLASSSAEVFSYRFAMDFDAATLRVQQLPEALSLVIQTEKGKVSEEQLGELIRDGLKKYPRAYGSTIAFVPSSEYPQGRAPYYYRARPDANEFLYADLAGKEYGYTEKDWYMRALLAGKGVWGEPYYDEGGGQTLMLTYSTPIFLGDTVVAVATVDLSLGDMEGTFNNYNVVENGYCFLVTDGGKILGYPTAGRDGLTYMDARSPKTRTVLGEELLERILVQAEQNKRFVFGNAQPGEPVRQRPILAYDNRIGEDSYYFVVPVQMNNSSLVIVAPESRLLQPVTSIIWKVVLFVLAVFIMITLILLKISERTVAPVKELVKQAQQISQGNYSYVVDRDSFTSELHELAAAYDAMRRNIDAGFRNLEGSRKEIIERLVVASEYKDHDTGLHVQRIGHYSQLLANSLYLPDKLVKTILDASKMHDVGKIGIPDKILLKPDKLTEEEYGVMQSHTLIGGKILSGSKSSLIQLAAVIAETHHEKWNGTGYPKKLAGKEIPLVGQIVSICDVFDALTSKRPYKDAWAVSQAVSHLKAERGKSFKPELVDLFIKILPKILKMKAQLEEELYEHEEEDTGAGGSGGKDGGSV